jgi:hypothetical protein
MRMPWPDNPLAATYHSALRGLQGRFDQAPGRRLCSPGHPASSQRRRSRTVWCRARFPDRTGRRFRREVGGHRPGPPARERDAVGGRKSWSGPGAVAGFLRPRPTRSRGRLVARLFRCAGVSGLSGAPCTIRTCDLQIRRSGSLSRLLAGRRGRRLSVEMVTRLSKGLRKPFEVVRAALELSIADACERRRLAAAAERARALLE